MASGLNVVQQGWGQATAAMRQLMGQGAGNAAPRRKRRKKAASAAPRKRRKKRASGTRLTPVKVKFPKGSAAAKAWGARMRKLRAAKAK